MHPQELVRAYYMRLYRLAYRLCSNAETAKDLSYCTLEKAIFSKGGSFLDERAYFAWLCRILTNLHRDKLRLKAANSLSFLETVPDRPDLRPDPARELELSEQHKLTRNAVRNLPVSLREVVVLHYFEGLSVQEMSETLEIPKGTVKYRLHEARKVLSQTLVQTFSEDPSLSQSDEVDA